MTNISALLGKTLTSVTVTEDTDGGDEIIFKTECGLTYKIHHYQDCCEHVYIEDIEGDIQSLVGNPILVAEQASNSGGDCEMEYNGKIEGSGAYQWRDESYTWTFYKLASIKGHVDIRWYGSSNGYYSESADFTMIEDDQ